MEGFSNTRTTCGSATNSSILGILVDFRLSLGRQQLGWLGCIQPDQPLLYNFLQLLSRHHPDIVAAWAVATKVTGELTLETFWCNRSIPSCIQVHGDGIAWGWVEVGVDWSGH